MSADYKYKARWSNLISSRRTLDVVVGGFWSVGQLAHIDLSAAQERFCAHAVASLHFYLCGAIHRLSQGQISKKLV